MRISHFPFGDRATPLVDGLYDNCHICIIDYVFCIFYQESVMSIDLAPTFLDLAGLQAPASFDGLSLTPIMTNQAHSFRDKVLVEYHGEHQDFVTGCPQYMNQGMAVSEK